MKCLIFSDAVDTANQLVSFFSGIMEVDCIVPEAVAKAVSAHCSGNIFAMKESVFPDSITAVIAKTYRNSKYDYVFLGSTAIGRDVAGMLSVDLGLNVAAEITSFKLDGSSCVTKRYFYGGKTVIEESSNARILTVMPGIAEPKSAPAAGKISEVSQEASQVTMVSRESKAAGSVDLEKASIIVSVGRGIGNKDNIEKIKPLADAVHGEIAGSRPVCLDYHWLSEDRQVGLSGKKVKPKMYIALGISGQIQHIAGIRGSKIVVAVNKDKSAPIFEEADYGLVGDLFQIVPKLVAAIKG